MVLACELYCVYHAYSHVYSLHNFTFIRSTRGLYPTPYPWLQVDDYKVKIGHLQEAVKTHFSALTSLKQQCTALKKEKDDANRLIEEYKLKYSDLETGMIYECTMQLLLLETRIHIASIV